MIEGRDLFTRIRSSQGDYDVRAHLAEMISLLHPHQKYFLIKKYIGAKSNGAMLCQIQKASSVRPLASIMEGLSLTLKVSFLEVVKSTSYEQAVYEISGHTRYGKRKT